MSVSSGEIKVYQSELSGSQGGAITPIEVPAGFQNLLFNAVKRVDLDEGAMNYIKVFVANTNALDTLVDARAWILLPPTSGEIIGLALGTPTDTDGSFLSYSSPDSYANGFALGSLGPGNPNIGLWIRRQTPVGLEPFDNNSLLQIAVGGLTT